MKSFYYLTGKDQNGPFTMDQLVEKDLTSETLIWTEGMENWQKLKDIPELLQTIKPKSVPPPPPSDSDEKITKTEVTGQLKVTTDKTPNPALEIIKPSKTALTWIIIWCGFHLFALLMSYSQIEFFNSQGKPDTKKFWPIVEYKRCSQKHKYINRGFYTYELLDTIDFYGLKMPRPSNEELKKDSALFKRYSISTYHDNSFYQYDGEECYFNGIFMEYDWTEFAFYVGGTILIYLVVRISNKADEKEIEDKS